MKNNHAKFHPTVIWNDRAFGFFERVANNYKKKNSNNKMKWVAMWDQFLIQ